MTLQRPEEMREVMGIAFDERQLAAICADLHPAVVIAGAGSGKTTVMAARVVWLVGTGQVRPEEILGLTFTNKAAAELAGRVRAALDKLALPPELAEQTTISTYHSFAQRLIGDYGIRLGIEPDATLLSDVRREQLAISVVRDPGVRIEWLSDRTNTVVDRLLRLDDALAERNVDPAALRADDERRIERMLRQPQQKTGLEIIETSRKRIELAALVERFRERKRALHCIDYADMGRLGLALARSRADVVSELRSAFRVVLLDEYQDTSVTQRLLMQALFDGGHAVMAVGDALQAIYEWRGASSQNITDFPEHFPILTADGGQLPASTFGLPTTRRFGQRIAAVANAITADLRATLPGVEPLDAQGDATYGSGTAEVSWHATQAAEFAWIAARLRAQHDDHGIAWGDMAVLLREHRNAGDIYQALAEAGVPAQILGKQGIMRIPDIAEVVAHLRVIHDPSANSAWVRILGGPRWRIGMRDLALLGRRAAELARDPAASGASGWEDVLARAGTGSDTLDVAALGDAIADPGDHPYSPAARARFAALQRDIVYLRGCAGWPVAELAREVVRTIGLDVEIAATEAALQRGRRVALETFLDLAASFVALEDAPTLSSFLRWLHDGETLGQPARIDPPVNRGAVSILTVHSAKGLQWQVVALPVLVDGVFPSKNPDALWPKSERAIPYALLDADERVPAELLAFPDDAPTAKAWTTFRDVCRPRGDAEETRLAYVAVTRAHRHLIASGSEHYTGRAATAPSRFLETLRDACIDGMGPVGPWTETGEAGAQPAPATAVWPPVLEPGYQQRLSTAAEAVRARMGRPLTTLDHLPLWDEAIRHQAQQRLESRERHREVPLPSSLTTTQVQALAADREAFTASLVRPMPKQPAMAARRGSAFHLWIEQRFGQQALLEREDLGVDREDDAALDALREAFLASTWAERTPFALELPFTLAIGQQVIRGRIDAVFRDDGAITVVDWKTNSREDADPLQLSIYRHAMARHFNVDAEDVRACFVYVATGATRWQEELHPLEDIAALLA